MAAVKSITNAPQALIKYIRESREELRKVSWPSRETTTRYTIIVIVSSLIIGAVIGGIDYLLTIVIERLI